MAKQLAQVFNKMTQKENIDTAAVQLLQALVAIPSFSKEEDGTATLIADFLTAHGVAAQRLQNNVWTVNPGFDASKPSILLCSHHDTVKPNAAYTRNPFDGNIAAEKLYGLGSNDAGASLVCLLAAFLELAPLPNLPYNLVLVAGAEEEISGRNGIELLWQSAEFAPIAKTVAFAIVGEPTGTNLAIAEKGLLVLDGVAKGVAGHAARAEGENAITKAMQDIAWLQSFRFPKISPLLGEVKMTVTVIETNNKAHNVVPDECRFVVDIRLTEQYTHEAVLAIVRQHLKSEVTARSLRIRPSSIDVAHPIVQAGLALGKTTYGSPTTSDQALIPVPSLKCGPGESARSHTADEFVYLAELEAGFQTYLSLLRGVLNIVT
jgi:acetylornithine deacetylase